MIHTPRRRSHRRLGAALLAIAGAYAGATCADDAATDPRFIPRDAEQATRGNLRLSSTLVDGGEPYPGTSYQVLRAEPAAFGQTSYRVMAAAGPGDEAAFDLAPGHYRVRARNGVVVVERPVEVPGHGVADLRLSLDAGELYLSARLADGGPAAAAAWFRVMREDRDPRGRPLAVEVAGDGYAEGAHFLLPAGDYLAEASYGNVRVTRPVSVQAAQPEDQVLTLDAGELLLATAPTPAADGQAPTHFALYAGGEPIPFAQADAAANVRFIVPAGEYRAVATRDLAAVERRLRLGAGETLETTLTLETGELQVYATLDGDGEPVADAWFRVHAVDTGEIDAPVAVDATRGPGPGARFVLPVGTYRVSAGSGEGHGETLVEVGPDDRRAIAVDLDAARVTLRGETATGGSAPPSGWFSIYRNERDATGAEWRRRLFHAGYSAGAEIVLPAGDYVATLRGDRRRGERAFSVVAGERRLVEIPFAGEGPAAPQTALDARTASAAAPR